VCLAVALRGAPARGVEAQWVGEVVRLDLRRPVEEEQARARRHLDIGDHHRLQGLEAEERRHWLKTHRFVWRPVHVRPAASGRRVHSRICL
jgi:hypothetical protein